MIQEILTYMIIGSALTIAFLKIKKKLAGKKTQQKVNLKKESLSTQHNCSECSAECMLRDAASPVIQNKKDLCKEIKTNSNEF